MKFSLLMSLYKKDNAEHFCKALQSVYESELLPNEIVLIEDGPIGVELKNIVLKFKGLLEIKSVVLDENVGLGRALSIGLSHCSYEWIARFDSDDICHSKRFLAQVEYIKANPHIGMLGSWIAEFEFNHEQTHSLRKPPSSYDDIVKYAKSRNPFNHMTVMYKKSAVLAAGGYQDDYLYEDYALWVRMIQNGVIMENLPEVLVFARTGNGMEARRGGVKYARKEISSQLSFYHAGFISKKTLLKNIMVRTPIRIIPSYLRRMVYRKLLRQ